MNSSLSFSLSEIAKWFDGRTTPENNIVEIPAFQRSLVWSAAQIEVLWDSLMRNIPIGAFSLLPMRGNEQFSKCKLDSSTVLENRFFLLDGQQRANAVALGFNAFPSEKNDKTPILWIDIQPDSKRQHSRKYFFYVTTPARPWGYRIDDANGESRSGKVPVSQYKRALQERGWKSKQFEKPAPAELWPVCARIPVPVSILRNLNEDQLSYVDLLVAGGNAPWVKHFMKACKGSEIPESCLNDLIRSFHNQLTEISKTKVVAMVAPEELANASTLSDRDDGNSEIALYFTRLNRGGTTPSREDLDYSVLKSILPELHKIDECANNRMHPARLAHLAMLVFLSRESDQGWKSGLSRRDIFDLHNKPCFVTYISEALSRDIETVDDWLLFQPEPIEGRTHGIPEYLRTRIIRDQPNLYMYLLLLAGQISEHPNCRLVNDVGFSRLLVALCTLLAWFGNDSVLDFASLAKRINEIVRIAISDVDNGVESIRNIFGCWLAVQIENKALLPPPMLDYFNQIVDATNGNDKEAVISAWSMYPDSDVANRIWYWSHEEGRGLVLYACRQYIRETFGSYDPASAVWNEDARPWDYDHIVPQSWLKGSYHGKCHELVSEFLNSIGNIAPIPFSENRSKNDTPPGEVELYKNSDSAKALFIEFALKGSTPRFVSEYLILEDNPDAAFDFARVTARRMAILYKKWWNDLEIEKLLSNCQLESRKSDIRSFAAILRGIVPEAADKIRIVYVVADGKQRDVSNNWDWARPEISCGIGGWFQRKDSNQQIRCFFCQTFQNSKRTIGLRRHPDETALDKGNGWWLADHKREDGVFDFDGLLIHGTEVTFNDGSSFSVDMSVTERSVES